MAIKIYNEGGGVIVDDGVKVTISNFSYIDNGDNTITIVDDDRPADAWNDFYYNIQDKLGAPVGATLQDVLAYLSDIQSLGDVESVNGKEGLVVLDTSDIADTLNKRYVTDADLTTLGNTSGTNTGDETTGSIQSKRPLKTIEGQSLEGNGDIDLTKADVGLSNVDNTSDANKPISTATQTALDNKAVKGVNSDITALLTLDYFDITETIPNTPGADKLRFRVEDKNGQSVFVVTDSDGFDRRMGRDSLRICRNTSGGNIAIAELVYITGSTGQTPNVSKAIATSRTTAQTIAMAAKTVANNEFTLFLRNGEIRGVDTSTFAEGTVLYLSDSVAGGFTSTRPTSPNFAIKVGIVTNQHATQGRIDVDIENVDLGFGTSDQFRKMNGAGTDEEFKTLTQSDISDVTITASNLNALDDGVDTTLHFHASDRNRANHTGTQDIDTTTTGTLPIGRGGSGQTTQQAAIDALTNVSAATNEHVLTKDTGSGNAVYKAIPAQAHNSTTGLQGGTTGEYYHLTSADHSRLTTWQPPSINIGEVSTIGITVFANDNDQGKYYSMPNNGADSKFAQNLNLRGANGLTYDGSNMAILVRWRPSINASAGNTVAWVLTTVIVKDGDNSATKFTAHAQQTQTITGFLQNITYTTQLATISGAGESGAHTLMFTVERNGTGASSDSFGGAVEVLGIELIKV